MNIEEFSRHLAERNGKLEDWYATYRPYRYYLPIIFFMLVIIASKLGMLALAVWIVVKVLRAMGVI